MPAPQDGAGGATPVPALERALALARAGRLAPPPNPAVGCVLTDPAGRPLGEGCTQAAGGAHAEVMALRDAASRGNDLRGATAWVTLEPCSHHGRTGPCCEALAAGGIARVVAAAQDPNPRVSGQGFERLRAAGVQVECLPADHPVAQQARDLNIGFFKRMRLGRPWVRMKIAASLDGITALPSGASQWITGEAARADGHAWRARACAVLTGIGTVLEDDPRLDVRQVATPRQPRLVVIDSRLQTPATARLLEPDRELLIYTAIEADVASHPLTTRGARLIQRPGPGGKVDLAAMLDDLAAREVNEVHVEAGHKLNGSLLRAGLVDELLVYLAPRLLGQGRGLAALGPLAALADGVALRFLTVDPVGDDLRVVARLTGRDTF